MTAAVADQYREMAAFCHFWRMTPAQFWDLEMLEYEALARHMDKVQAAHQQPRHPRRR